MWSNALDSGWIKFFVNSATKLIKVIDWLNEKFSILGTTLISLSAFKGLKFLFTSFNVGNKVAAFFDAINGKTMKEAWKNLKNFSVANNDATAATIALRVETGKMTAMEAVRQTATRGLVLSRIALTDIEAKELLASTALNESEKQAIINGLGLNASRQRLTLTTLQQAVAERKLTAQQALYMATSARLVSSQVSLTSAKATEILVSKGVSAEDAQEIITKLGLGSATTELTAATIAQAIADGTLTTSQGALAMSLLATTGAAKGLKSALIGLWTALWPMLILAGAVAVIYGIVKAVDAWITTSDELAESIENTRSEIQDIESEIESLNDQIDETQSRMSELLAMPSLSFTEEEELENLKQQNAELERTLALQEALKEQKEAKLKTDTKTQIEKVWNGTSAGKKDYALNVMTGEITHDNFWRKAYSGKEILDFAFPKYEEYNSQIKAMEDAYVTALNEVANGEISKDTYLKMQQASGNTGINQSNVDSAYADMGNQDEYLKKYKQNIANVENNLGKISDGVALVLGEMAGYAEGLSYGDDAEINQFLDELNYYNYKWQETQGISATSSAIKSMFDDTQNQAVKSLETKLKEIAASDEYADTEEGNAQRIADATIIVKNALNDETGAYNRLQSAVDTMGYSAEDIARTFVQLGQIPDSSTVSGITAQYQKGIEILEQFKSTYEGIQVTNNDGESELITFDSLFKFNDELQKWEAIDTQIAKVLQGADETVREEFANIVESVKNEEKDLDEAITSFNISALLSVAKLEEETLSSLNQDMFKNVKDDISGLIDTFSELRSALEDTASAMDLLSSAEKQMNSSGQISVKTALELIETTDNWADVLTISEDKITLNENAEEALIGSKLQLIEKNIDLALTEAQLQLAQIDNTVSTLDLAEADITTASAQIAYRDAMNQASAATAGLGAAIGALVNNLKSGKLLSVGSGVIDAFTSAYDNALTVIAQTDAPTADELKKKINDLKAQKALISKVGSSKDFKNYYDYDSTPGDKYSDAGDTALEKIQEKYEAKLANMEHQQQYLQNEIDRLQAENKPVSKSYYDQLIAIEEQKIKLYEQQRAELMALLKATKQGTEEYNNIVNAIWESELAIQESTKAVIDFRQEIVNLYKEAFDKISKVYGDLDDLFEDQQSYIDKYNELLGLRGEPVTESSIRQQLAIEQQQMADNEAQLASLKAARDEALANGVESGSDEWIEMESNIRDVEAAILDNQIAIENYKDAIIDLYTEAFDKLNQMFGNKTDFFSNQQSYIEGYSDYLEALGIDVPQEVYDKLIELEADKRATNVENLVKAREHLADLESQGLNATNEEWVDAQNNIVELEKAIQDNDIAMAEWQKTIREMDFSVFDDFIDRIGNLESEISNIIDLVSDEDMAFEDGTWTKEGLLAASMYYQQMEIAKQKAKEYADEIDELNQLYDSGALSEKDYYERMQTLKDGQWDAIKTVEDLKDSIVDLNSARIDEIERGITKEIDAYQELIDMKKKELDAERD